MLLKDAESKEQVQRLLDEGDEELREDIEWKLQIATTWWERHGLNSAYYDDAESVGQMIHDNEEFLKAVVEQSPSDADLSNVPEKYVRDAVTREARSHGGSVFEVEERRGGARSFRFAIPLSGEARFPHSKLPKKSEMIPTAMAQEFWDGLPGDVSWDQTHTVEENHGLFDADPMVIVADDDHFKEWCTDILREYMSDLVRKDKPGAIAAFLKYLESEDTALATKVKTADLDPEELLDFAARWFEGESDEILDTLRDYFSAMDKGADQDRTVIAEWSKQDIYDMGIRSGILFEEAPWKLIKLHPSDLRLEGTLMGHCVGDKGMGYIKALADGDVEIWSLRSRNNKPRFTLEVHPLFHLARAGTDLAKLERGQRIQQLKGKANRLPGFADAHARHFKFPEEIAFWQEAFRRLDVDPRGVQDFYAARQALAQSGVTANAAQCIGFDRPYRPPVHSTNPTDAT